MNITGLRRTWKFIFALGLLVSLAIVAWHGTGYVGANSGTTFCLGSDDDSGEPIAYRIYDAMNTSEDVPWAEENVTWTDNNGCFKTSQSFSEAYIFFVQASVPLTDYLTAFESFSADRNNTVNLTTTLIQGDANADNKISGSDSSLFLSVYTPGENICLFRHPNYDPRLDFNENGCVDDSDESILQSNLNHIDPLKGADEDDLPFCGSRSHRSRSTVPDCPPGQPILPFKPFN